MAANETCVADLDVYTCSDKGLLLPIVNEYTWPIAGRATVYLLGLLWCFLGVAIVADIFMCAIEKITSKTTVIKVASSDAEKGYEEIEVKVWNDTVANLTLMALGSSAPEILLSCIEVIFNGFNSGALGPSTIVGSAAFNLLVITAVCVVAIPSPEVRTIRAFKVFLITAFFSLFAYVWLVIILVVVSPNYVELWEAIITLLFFPILVILAYIADKDYCGKKQVKDESMQLGFANDNAGSSGFRMPWKRGTYKVAQTSDDEDVHSGKMTDTKMREFIKTATRLHELHPNLSEEDIAKLAAAKIAEETPHNHLWYRINAAKALGGNPRLTPSMSVRLHDVFDAIKAEEGSHALEDDHIGSVIDFTEGGKRAIIEFTAAQSAILEKEKRVRVTVVRHGKTDCRVFFRIETIDGTAEAEKDYIAMKQTLVFEKNETEKHVDIEVIDDNEWEPDEVFFVKLSLRPEDAEIQNCILGKKAIQEITIINDDEPGTFEFSKPSLLFRESAGKALIPVERSNGCDGRAVVRYRTEDMSAKSGQDYEGGEGELVFEHGEMTKTLELTIYDDQEKEKDECFKVELTEVSEGAKFGRIKKTVITIVNDDDFNSMVNRLTHLTNVNIDALRVDSSTWADQFRNAMNVNGGDLEGASHIDYLMHFLTFGWKLIFAIVPPASIWGGWLCFCVALMMIGLLTAIISDLASIFGCLVNLEDSVTAITFVALGTSLPDLFASKQAATQEKYADYSIGNVTGSNSVNVFLGLGLPWVIAAIFWTVQGKTFYVAAGSLSFSVVIYCICGTICLTLLILRRYLAIFGKGELGGKFGMKIATAVFLVCLWFLYVLLSAFQAYNHIPGF